MITKDHISVRRRNKTIASLEARISILSEIVKKGEIPNGFEYHKSDERLMKWDDESASIYKVGVNSARDNYPGLWEDLQVLRRSMKKLERTSKQVKEKIKSKTKDNILTTKRESDKQIKRLTNELITLRRAYLDLLSSVKQDEHKSRVKQDAIRNHHQHHGLQATLRGQK